MTDIRDQALKRALVAVREMRVKLEALEARQREPIAIVGMACRFPPSVNTLDDYWALLIGGIDGIRETPCDRWDVEAFYAEDPSALGKTYVRHGGFLDNVTGFDAEFFGITPREVSSMDPQQRLLLEVTWEALEHAGIPPKSLQGSKSGVYIGLSAQDFGQLMFNERRIENVDPYIGTGSSASVTAGRLSYALGLHGPALALDTACSSSLTAIDVAIRDLRTRRCDLALAGGVSLMLSPLGTIYMSKLRALSPTGRCRSFDAGADGYVRGEGCGVIALKRLSDARASSDRVLAVIAGAAINHDGRSSGLTVPNGTAQESLLREALKDAGLAASDVSYVEAHGTGTPLGDPIEMHALGAVFAENRPKDRPLLVGTVKSNIGHLEAAAGVAGVIKTVLAIQHGCIPPSLHFEHPNTHIRWAELPVSVVTEVSAWPHGRRPTAGVSAFGFSGTNAHVLLQAAEPVALDAPAYERPAHVVTLSASSKPALREMAHRLERYLASHPDMSIGDVAHTANTGRSHFSDRIALVARDADALRASLAVLATGADQQSVTMGHLPDGSTRKLAFLFTGQGAQHVGMGRRLYETQPTFRATIDECDEAVQSLMGRSLISVLYPESGSPDSEALLHHTMWAQPATFAVELALARVWESWGIYPSALLGHSLGEYVAACVAGVFDAPTGVRLVAERGRLMQALPPGGRMVAVEVAEETARLAIEQFGGRVSIAAVNGPQNVVVSGAEADVGRVIRALARGADEGRPLVVSHAFHSSLMEPMLEPFARVLSGIRFSAPRLRVISNMTGAASGDGIATPDYWLRHVMSPVRFGPSIAHLMERGYDTFLEVGPNSTLSSLGRLGVREGADVSWFASLRRGRDDWDAMLDSVAGLYTRGVAVDWTAFDRPYGRTRVTLPTYPFQRIEYRYEPMPPPRAATSDYSGSIATPSLAPPLEVSQSQVDDSLYDIRWQLGGELTGPDVAAVEAGGWIIVPDRQGVADALAVRLRERGCSVALVTNATGEVLRSALASAARSVGPCRGVIHCAALDTGNGAAGGESIQHLPASCGSLLEVARVLAGLSDRVPRLWVVTRGAVPVADEVIDPFQTLVLGLANTIAVECADAACVRVDLDPSNDSHAAMLEAEILHGGEEDQVAFRAGTRHVPRLVRSERHVSLEPKSGHTFDPAAAYLVTGGFGGIGQRLVEWMVARGARHVVITTRSAPSTQAQSLVRRCEAMGATIVAERGDVSKRDDVRRVVSMSSLGGRPLRGVFHASGVLDDAMLGQQDWKRFAGVLAPKVIGAWNLHELTADQPLDYFVLFSSTAAVFGAPGQANYAAANAFLDGLAHYRRAQGRPALSINWGAWSEIGLAARLSERDQNRMRDKGAPPMAPELALAALERIVDGTGQCIVMSIRWPIFLRGYAGKIPPVFERFVLQGADIPIGGDAMSGALAFRTRLLAMPQSERLQAIIDFIAGEVARIACLPMPGMIDVRAPLTAIGIDSLMSVELRNALVPVAGRRLDTTVVYDHPTIAELAAFLQSMMAGADSTALAGDSQLPPRAEWSERVASRRPETDKVPTSLEASSEESPGTRISTGRDVLTFDMSEGQRALWLVHQLAPESPAYNIAFALRIRGNLDPNLLHGVLSQLVGRHEALRSTFHMEDRLVQRVSSTIEADVELIDATAWSREELQEQVEATSRRPFDLAKGPPFRSSVFCSSPDEHVLLLTVHHLTFDGWSLGILFPEFKETLHAALANRLPMLGSTRVTYADFVWWQAKMLASDIGREHRDYWRNALTGVLPALRLREQWPLARTARPGADGHPIVISSELSSALKALAIEQGTTLYGVLLAAYRTLLRSETGAEDLVIGSPVTGRTESAFSSVIGYFVNMLPLRIITRGDMTFRALLRFTSEKVREALNHQDYPFVRIVQDLGCRRTQDSSPVFQTTFNFLTAQAHPDLAVLFGKTRSVGRLKVGPLTLEAVNVPQQQGQFELQVEITDVDGVLRGYVKYDTRLYERHSIAAFAARYSRILAEVAADADRRLDDYLAPVSGAMTTGAIAGEREEFEL